MGLKNGTMYGIEVKSVTEIPKDGLTPPKSSHCFEPKQIRELNNICKEGGVGIGVIVCGNTLFWFYPDHITEDGQVDCKKLMKTNHVIHKTPGIGWELGAML